MGLQRGIVKKPFADEAIQQRNARDAPGRHQPNHHGARHLAAQSAHQIHVARSRAALY